MALLPVFEAFSPTYRALPAPSNQAALTFKVAQLGQIQDLTRNANTAGMPLCHKGSGVSH